MKLTTKLVPFICALAISGYAHASTDEAIAAAEKARKAAAEVGYEWRDTAKMIKQARELAAKGESAEAIKIAHKAEEQGKDALSQYRNEQGRYLKSH